MSRKAINLKNWGFINSIYIFLFKFGFKKNYSNNYFIENENYNALTQAGYTISHAGKKDYCVKFSKSRSVFLRRFSSDYTVFNQLIVDNEYGAYIDLIRRYNIEIKVIIDAGSNIGLASLVFSDNFPEAKVFCIEPSTDNFKQVQKNITYNKIKGDVLHKGLWSKETILYVSKDFRDGREWAYSLTESPNGTDGIGTVSINAMVQKYAFKSIDLLKIDIEGSEFAVFGNDNNLDFLKITKTLAVEIHSEFGEESKIIKILESYGFKISRSGEYFIGINSNFNA